MKIVWKIIICVIVIVIAVGAGYLIFNGGKEKDTNASANLSNNMHNNSESQLHTDKSNEVDIENKDYIGEEENRDEQDESETSDTTTVPDESSEENEEQTTNSSEGQVEPELSGKDKAVDIVTKQYATEGQTVRFDHMKGENYIIKLNDGTAVTWYIVNGTTWEAEEY